MSGVEHLGIDELRFLSLVGLSVFRYLLAYLTKPYWESVGWAFSFDLCNNHQNVSCRYHKVR